MINIGTPTRAKPSFLFFFAIFGQLRLLTLSDFIPSLLAASSYVMKITSDSELIRSSVRILSGL